MAAEKLVQLDPTKVQADDNIRFALLPHRVDAMAESILARGGIQSPVEVEKLAEPVNGFTHRLTAGFYRHAAALKLNTEQQAGITLPAIVRQPVDALDRLNRQISENKDRENLSPMDEAVAIKRLFDAGVSRADVRKLFSRPGGRKGLAMQPASNAHINMVLSFLDLPESVQAKIHDGRVGVAAAYELTKAAPEQREAILARAEDMRQKQLAREERADELEAKREEMAAARTGRVNAAKAAMEAAIAEHEAAQAAQKEAYAAKKEVSTIGREEERIGKAQGLDSPKPFTEWTPEEKEAFAGKVTAAKKAAHEADKRLSKATKERDKAERAYKAVAEPAVKEAEPTPPAAKPAAKGKAKSAVSQTDIKKAAAETGAGKPVALNAADARAAAAELAKSRFAKVKAIGQVFAKLLAGELTPKAAETDLGVITGERKTQKA